ncbi:phosphoglycerol transferase [Afipia sp. P52-10]|uniref:sulfatase-like hydrolase/transferase n=1 Tax=Afipia sp. P52-10 TaxID=1429916 RepID=UPI0003DEF8EC|nr:sulfatase-like hydrolase/transferase [Afipia sp. P52-10]ETR79213.1 phosphoglycerol transferase [Afipia sp. P52-10]
MAPLLPSESSKAATAASPGATGVGTNRAAGIWRIAVVSKRWFGLRTAIVVALYLACIGVLYRFEYGPLHAMLALSALAFACCLVIALFRRPAIAAALTLVVILILAALSELKFGVTQLTLTFLDFLIVDRDTFSFLMTTHPQLKTQIVLGAVVALPLAWLIIRFDPFRIRRRAALISAGGALTVMTALSVAYPEQPWEPFQGVNHISNLARSGVTAVSHLAENGWIEAEPKSLLRSAYAAPADDCDAGVRRPHIILLLDESSFDITAAPGIKVPDGYSDFFKSFDGKTRTFMAESTGGPTWYTEFNVLTGLSARSFGKMRYYVTRIAAGRVTRGLPQALKRCGYRTFSLYPSYGNFLSARNFQRSTGVGHFADAADMRAPDEQQPDTFYFDQALRLFERERDGTTPLFAFVYLAANHFPWTTVFRPDLTPDWSGPGNTAEVDEYIRRQAMTVEAYTNFVAALQARYPDDEFLIVRFGDHQPALSQKVLEPDLPPGELGKRVQAFDPRYYATYYALDGINYRPKNVGSALATLDAAYLPIVVQEAAGVPLDPSFAEQKRIMLRCGGTFYACREGAEARRFNRLLIDAGLIKGL